MKRLIAAIALLSLAMSAAPAAGTAEELLALSTVLVSPTSASAPARSFRPTIEIEGRPTRVLVEQTTVVDPECLGRSGGRRAAAAEEAKPSAAVTADVMADGMAGGAGGEDGIRAVVVRRGVLLFRLRPRLLLLV